MATYDLATQTVNPTQLRKGDILNCSYSGSMKSIELPKGQYKLEVWGAQGGSYSTSYNGGVGGYSVGTINLNDSTFFYLYSGGQPARTTSSSAQNGGFNGGGKSSYSSYDSTTYGQGGGGGSDIRIGQDSLYARVIVAGGGAGSSNNYNAQTTRYGGGETAGGQSGYQATQTSGNAFGIGQDGYMGGNYNYTSTGSGGGWYGGKSNQSRSDSTNYSSYTSGGSGYVYTSSTASNYPSGCLLNSSLYLTSASTKAGNTSFTSPTGTTETGHSGNGYCRITIIEIVGGCENIYVKVSGSSEQYKVLQYIEGASNTNNQNWIKTNVVPTDSMSFTLEFALAATASYQRLIQYGGYYHAESNNTQASFLVKGGAQSNTQIGTTSTITVGTKYTWTTSSSGVYLGTTKICDRPTNQIANATICLGHNDVGQYINQDNRVRFYSFVLNDNNVVIMNLVPVKRTSDNKVGMYDTIAETFYENRGTGSFTAGAETGETISKTSTMWIKSNNLYIKIASNKWLGLMS